ncbi:MAG: GNAT family N-acetyltransferase [Verrucomicrobiota bacterium]
MPPSDPTAEERKLAKVYESCSRFYMRKKVEFAGGWLDKIEGTQITSSPYWDFINGIHSPGWKDSEVERCLDLTLRKFNEYGAGLAVSDGPSTKARNLREELLKRGFRCSYYVPYFHLDLRQKIEGTKSPKGIEVGLQADFDVFKEQAHPWIGPLTTKIRKDSMAMLRAGCEAKKPWMYAFTAKDGDDFVGSASYIVHRGNVGVYDVMVKEAYRRKGIGHALMNTLCLHAQEKGYKAAGLSASSKGFGLYVKAGFREVGRYGFYLLSKGGVRKALGG